MPLPANWTPGAEYTSSDQNSVDTQVNTNTTTLASHTSTLATHAALLAGLVIGTHVQAYNAALTSWAAKSVPSGTAVGTTDTQTLTNKRVTGRSTAVSNTTSWTIDSDSYDYATNTGLTAGVTVNNPTGTPTTPQTLWISLTGTASRAITWGSGFEASTVALPTTTSSTSRLDVGFVWNSVTSKWRCVAVA